MNAATQSNINTAVQAKESGERAAFYAAFSGGAVMGLAVAIFGLLGLFILLKYVLFYGYELESLLSSFGLGASLVAFFCSCWWWYLY